MLLRSCRSSAQSCLSLIVAVSFVHENFRIAGITWSSTSRIKPRVLSLHKLNSVALVRKRTIPTERTSLVSEVSANFYG
jgi:hypothetical protein